MTARFKALLDGDQIVVSGKRHGLSGKPQRIMKAKKFDTTDEAKRRNTQETYDLFISDTHSYMQKRYPYETVKEEGEPMHIVARLREIINPKDEQQITDFFKAVEEFEVQLLTDALRRGRTKTESARLLSLNRTTFLAKLKTRGIV